MWLVRIDLVGLNYNRSKDPSTSQQHGHHLQDVLVIWQYVFLDDDQHFTHEPELGEDAFVGLQHTSGFAECLRGKSGPW